jgi:hypothetical protein
MASRNEISLGLIKLRGGFRFFNNVTTPLKGLV